MNYEEMTLQELELENEKLMEQKEAIREKQKRINEIMTKKMVEAETRKKYKSMSEAEKEALTQIISGAGGIKSKEEMGIL
jgi:hypothetical protein